MTYNVTVSSKGQITIPIEARRKLGVGKRVLLDLEEDKVIMRREPTLEDIRAALGFKPGEVPKKVRNIDGESAWAEAAVENHRRKSGY